jgi:hypothetical protein
MAMSFDDKFLVCLQNIDNINKPDYTSSELNYYADFVELLTLFSGEDGITQGDIQDRFFGEKDYKNAQERDTDETFIRTIFLLIVERISLYADTYPYQYNDSQVLSLKENLSNKNKLYISLLLSSKLNIFRSFQTELTTEFENIAFYTLRGYLPSHSVIREFGKNSHYTGNAKAKITQLAKDLNIEIKHYELSQINERNQQERGLDIVGWIPFSDQCANNLLFLVQCACGKEYESKQHDTRRFKNYLSFYKTNPQQTLFIPYSLINVRDKKFYHSDYIEDDFLIFERKRILEFYNDEAFNTSESIKIVEQCINHNGKLN